MAAMSAGPVRGTPAAGPGPRVVITGATGNLGSALVRRLAADDRVAEIVSVARRPAGEAFGGPGGKVRQVCGAAGDVRTADLGALFRGAAAVVHLAWVFHPTRHPDATWETNVTGTGRVLAAVHAARVPVVLHASSVAAYSPGPKDGTGEGSGVDESWPTHGWPRSAYCREKAYTERLLDVFEHDHPAVRVVRLRPGIVLQRSSAAEQRRIFAGPFVPGRLLRPDRLPVPDLPGLRFQAVHAEDVAEAMCRALHEPVDGAFNLAAAPVVDAAMLAATFGTRVIGPFPVRPVRAALDAAWRLRLSPLPVSMFEAILRFPVMDTGRAAAELGWRPRSAQDTVREFAQALREDAGGATPPLAAPLPGGRVQEIAGGLGERT
nr:NAD-dependent epimerase/dehydratase family protein [Streptomyces sp. MST-110588]